MPCAGKSMQLKLYFHYNNSNDNDNDDENTKIIVKTGTELQSGREY